MKTVLCLFVLLLLGGCSGLPQARELDGMSLMRTMGVDWKEEDDLISVTVTTARREEDTSGKEEPTTRSVRRETLSGACQALRASEEGGIFLGHVEELLLGEALTAQGRTEEILRYFAKDQQLGLGVRTWLVRGAETQTLLEKKEPAVVQIQLDELPARSDLGIPGMERRAGAVLTDLLEGRTTWVPALTLVGEGKEQAAFIWGYGILDASGLCGWVTGDAARGLELAQGYPGSEWMELEQGSVRLRSVKLYCIPVFEGENITGLQLDLQLSAQVEELLGNPERLQNEVEQRTLQYLSAAVEQAQQINTDFLGLNTLIGIAMPEYWNQICEQWPENFAALEIDARSQVRMIGLGE